MEDKNGKKKVLCFLRSTKDEKVTLNPQSQRCHNQHTLKLGQRICFPKHTMNCDRFYASTQIDKRAKSKLFLV